MEAQLIAFPLVLQLQSGKWKQHCQFRKINRLLQAYANRHSPALLKEKRTTKHIKYGLRYA
jgi:hypothetical protein